MKRAHISFDLEEAKEKFDELLDLVEQGKNVGLVDAGKLRGLLIPFTQESPTGSSAVDLSVE